MSYWEQQRRREQWLSMSSSCFSKSGGAGTEGLEQIRSVLEQGEEDSDDDDDFDVGAAIAAAEANDGAAAEDDEPEEDHRGHSGCRTAPPENMGAAG